MKVSFYFFFLAWEKKDMRVNENNLQRPFILYKKQATQISKKFYKSH